MQPFTLEQASNLDATVRLASARGAEYIAGGTDMLQLMKDGVRNPSALIDLEGVGLDRIEFTPQGLRLGAMARMSDVADHPEVMKQYPVIAESLLASASPQVRNLGTMGGNILQRTRCTYFRDVASACNKRVPGSGCSAIHGINRNLAIFGGSADCIATHASDLAVALLALDAVVHLTGPDGAREVKLIDFHVLPEDHPEIETVLEPGELITAISVPAAADTRRSHYLKVRDRASFEFALTAAAVAIDIEDGMIRSARVAAGGVGTKPWRLPAVEQALAGKPANAATWAHAGDLAAAGATAQSGNRFKLGLLRNTVTRAFEQVGGMA